MSRSGLLVLACVLFEVNAVTNIIDPTVTNRTGSFYIASEYYNNGEYYQSGSLTCNALHCLVVCDVASGCESLSIHTTSIVDTITLKCTELESCYDLTLSGDISSYADIHCGAERACYSANLDRIPTRSDINVDIICVNPSITTSSSRGACYQSYFDIYGYNNYGVKGSNMSMVCGAYDCYQMHLTALDFNQFDLYCNDTGSCGSASISGEGSNQFNVHCGNEGSCKSAYIWCPFHQEQSCQIDCAAYTESCTDMTIIVPSNYIYNYLDIRCPSEALYPPTFEVCNDIGITCDDWRGRAYLSYDFNDDTWNCGVYAASSYCCPYLGTKTPTVPTTKAPFNKPNTNDPSTQAPTRVPSTKVPTTKTPSSKAPTTKPPTMTAPTMATTHETDITSAMDANNAQAQTDQSHHFGSVIAVIVVFSSLMVILLVVLILVITFYFKAWDRKIRNPPDHALAVELVEQSANNNNAKIEVNCADDDDVLANALEGKDNDVVQQINQTAF